VFLLS